MSKLILTIFAIFVAMHSHLVLGLDGNIRGHVQKESVQNERELGGKVLAYNEVTGKGAYVVAKPVVVVKEPHPVPVYYGKGKGKSSKSYEYGYGHGYGHGYAYTGYGKGKGKSNYYYTHPKPTPVVTTVAGKGAW